MILFGLSSTALTFTASTHGITPAQIAAMGDHDSPLLNDIDGGDESTELLWTLLPPLPASGTTEVDDTGGYALIGAADGVHTQAYRLLAMPATGAPVVGEAVITINVGAAGGAPLVAAPCEQASTSGGGAVTQTHILAGSACSQSAQSSAGAVGQTHLLAAASCAQAALSSAGSVWAPTGALPARRSTLTATRRRTEIRA